MAAASLKSRPVSCRAAGTWRTPETLLHAVQRPEEIHGRGPAGAQVVGHLLEAIAYRREVWPRSAACRGRRRTPPRRRWPGRRGTRSTLDRLPDVLDGAAVAVVQPRRQQSLVDEADEAVDAADPFDGARDVSCRHRFDVPAEDTQRLVVQFAVAGDHVGAVDGRRPSQSVKRPPASSMIGATAATSQTCIACSTITSAAPSAISTKP